MRKFKFRFKGYSQTSWDSYNRTEIFEANSEEEAKELAKKWAEENSSEWGSKWYVEGRIYN